MKENIFIYWDILLLRVIVISFLMLLAGGLWLGRKVAIKKYILMAVLQGSLWLVIFWLSLPGVAAFCVETVLFFLGLVFCYGLRGKGMMLGSLALLQSVFCFYGRKRTLFLFILSVAIFYLSHIFMKKQKKSCRVSFSYEDKMVHCKAIVDSGNFLQEPYGHRPVCVIEDTCIPSTLPQENILFVPYKTVGTDSGLMPVIKVGPVLLETPLQQNVVPEMLLGISREPIGNKNEYQMLLHRSFEELI